MRVTHVKLGRAESRQSKRLLTICAELAGPHEFMTITVSVRNSDKEHDVRQQGIARTQDLARDFSNLPVGAFSLDQARREG